VTDSAGGSSHWDQVFATTPSAGLSWHEDSPHTSLRLLKGFASPAGSVIDIGAGSSTLAAVLLDAGWHDITVLDISAAALAISREHLGDRADQVSFLTTDLLAWTPQRAYDCWHDRAVFHFLTDPAQQQAYVRHAARAVTPGGVLVLGTFAPDGPPICSGLATQRYTSDQMASTFADGFTLEHAERQEHLTPNGAVQPFTWVVLRAKQQ
jgi:SAM-dependent methyltransferase